MANHFLIRKLELFGLTLLGLFNILDFVSSINAFSVGFTELNAWAFGVMPVVALNMAITLTSIVMILMAYLFARVRNNYVRLFILSLTYALLGVKAFAVVHNILIVS